MKKHRSGSRRRGPRAVIAAEFLVLSSVVLVGESLIAADKERPTIHIFTYNCARFSNATLEEAEAVAARVLFIAGIETRWSQCRESEADSNAGPNPCRLEGGQGIYLLLIPRAMPAHWASGKTSLGFSIIPGGGKKGDTAYVFPHRVEEIAAAGRVSASQVLGHAMAHEIGHLLLNSNEHSDVGIMQADWCYEQTELLRNGRLWFTSAQSRRMRAEVLARQKASGLVQAGTARK
jgi:hypothetical protein